MFPQQWYALSISQPNSKYTMHPSSQPLKFLYPVSTGQSNYKVSPNDQTIKCELRDITASNQQTANKIKYTSACTAT